VPRDQVFISYSHEDTKWREDLEKNLKPYLRGGSITSWSDQQIVPGSEWFKEIQSALTNSRVAVLLVSPDFLASDFIHEHELAPFLKEAEQGGVKILWVPIRNSAYRRTPLKNYQAVLSPETPLAAMTRAKRDQAWVKICEEIEKAASQPGPKPPPEPEPVPEPFPIKRDEHRASVPEHLQENVHGSADNDDLKDGTAEIRESGLEPTFLKFEYLIHETVNSKVAVYSHGDERLVLKRTRANLCQFGALCRLLRAREICGRDQLTVSISLSTALWAANDFVFELRRYHEGVGLDELVLRNRFKITGEFLGRFHNAFVHALFGLHDVGVVHRDINPQNLVFTKSGDIVLLDSTFACEVGSAQLPINSGYYTAPEQLKGRATFASDFYSLGATEFFMSNGFPHASSSSGRYLHGLMQVDYGVFCSRWEGSEPLEHNGYLDMLPNERLLAGLLLNDEKFRPSGRYDLLLKSGSRALESSFDVLSILDAGDAGYLICSPAEYKLVRRDEIVPLLTQVLDAGGAQDPILRENIESHLSGSPRWRL